MINFSKRQYLVNPHTGTIVYSTGRHGDRSTRYSFEAFRVDPKTKKPTDVKEWFPKMNFELYEISNQKN
jgi:hypothetical protein